MSDTIYQIIPSDYAFYPEDDRIIEGAVNILKMYVKADNITWEKYENPAFVDCGENLEAISCPYCGSFI